MTTTRKTEVGVYTGEFFLRCFLLFLCGFLELGVLLMGDFCLFLGAKWEAWVFTATTLLYHVQQAGTATEVFRTTRALGHWSFLLDASRA